MAQSNKKMSILRKQPINRRVVYALLPCLLGAVYYFGWRSLAVVLWCTFIGFTVEYIFCRLRKEPVSEAVFVTTLLFALIMPPSVPWHVAGIGVAFAVMFGKEVFGGFGRNIFNPAMAGRCFVYICFPVALTGMWTPPEESKWGAFSKWTAEVYPKIHPVSVTGASPMGNLKAGKMVVTDDKGAWDRIPFHVPEDQQFSISKKALYTGQLFGRISGTMGVTSALLICIGGIYLFYTKTASRATILSVIITYAVLNQVLYWFEVDPVPGALPAVFGGGFLLGAFFMATDPVSSPKTTEARIIYGIIIGTFTTVIRNFSIFNGGLMFSILIGNMFAPILDYAVKAYKSRPAVQEASS